MQSRLARALLECNLQSAGTLWLQILGDQLQLAATLVNRYAPARDDFHPALVNLLVDAARRLGPIDPAMARQTYLEALGAAMYAGRVDADSGVLEVAEAARAAPAAMQPKRARTPPYCSRT